MSTYLKFMLIMSIASIWLLALVTHERTKDIKKQLDRIESAMEAAP
jgi:hypothetical protein